MKPKKSKVNNQSKVEKGSARGNATYWGGIFRLYHTGGKIQPEILQLLQLEMLSSCQFFCVNRERTHTLVFSDRPQHEMNMWVKCRHSWTCLVLSCSVNQPQSKNKNAFLVECTFHIHVTFFR